MSRKKVHSIMASIEAHCKAEEIIECQKEIREILRKDIEKYERDKVVRLKKQKEEYDKDPRPFIARSSECNKRRRDASRIQKSDHEI